MRILAAALKDGVVKGIKTTLLLLRVMLPVYIVVVLLKYSPVMPFLERVFTPAMRVFRMPGEAAVPILAGMFGDEYAVIAAMSGFPFSTATVTTVAMMTLLCHSLPVESAVNRQIGLPVGRLLLFRLCAAVAMGLLCGMAGRLLS